MFIVFIDNFQLVKDQACNFLLISYFMLTYYMQTLLQKTEAQFLDSNNQVSALLFDLQVGNSFFKLVSVCFNIHSSTDFP